MGKKTSAPSGTRAVAARKLPPQAEAFDLTQAHEAVLDALPAHVALLDHRGVIVAVNAAWRAFASDNGMPGAGFGIGQDYLGVCESAQGDCAAEAQAAAAGIRQVLRGERPDLVLEYPCHAPDQPRWFRLMVTPLTDGKTTGAVVMHINITERKLAELELQERDGHLRRLTEQLDEERIRLILAQAVAKVGSWQTDLETLAVSWSVETHRIFGTDPATFHPTHQTFLERVHPEDRAAVDAAFVRSTGEWDPQMITHRLLLPDGRIKFIEERWQIFGDNQGRPRRALGTCQDITERREAEVRLQEAQSLLGMASRLSRLGAWQVELPAMKLTWSEGVSAIHETPPGFTPGLEDAINYYAPEFRERIRVAFMACAERGTPFDEELQILTAKGRRVWVRSIGEAVRDEAGRITRVQGAFQDISDRKQAETEVRRLAERLTTTLESMTDAFMTLDRNWCFSYLNPEAEKLLHRSEAELLGRNMWTEFPGAVDSPFRREYERAVAENASVTFEAYYPLPLDRWFDVRAYPTDEGLAVYFHDITGDREAREQLRMSEERFREMAENIGDVFYNYDPVHNQLLYGSPAFERIWGRPLAEIYAKPTGYLDALPAEDRPAAEAAFQRQLQGEETVVDFRVLRPDGSVRWVREHAVPVRDEQGRMERIVGTMRDITLAKEAEAATRRYGETLAGIVDALQEIAALDRPLPEIMRVIAERAQVLTGADSGVVEVIDGDAMVCQVATGAAAGRTGERLPLHGTLTGLAIRSDTARVCEDTETDGQVDPEACRQAGVRSLVVAPLRSGAQVIGALKMLSGRPRAFGPRDAHNLQILVESLGAVIQRRAATERLSESEERFRKLLQGVPTVAIQGYATDGTVQYWNDASERFYGYTRDEALGRNLLDLIIPPEMREGVRAALRGVAEGGEIPHTELELMRKDGSRITVFSSHAVVRREGRPAELFCIDIDLSERKRAEQRVAEQAALLDKANDAILVRDLDHRVLFWNRSAERLYGWTAAEAVGRFAHELHYDKTEALDEATAAVLADGEWVGEIEQRTRDGRKLMVEGHWTLVRDPQGQPRSILAINTDITERKSLEQQFLRAQRMESIGTLAGGIAHDLNNLLAPIVMGAGLLQRHELPDSGREILRNIERGARRSTELVRQVLSFARGVEGERIALQLGHIIREIDDIVASTFPKNIVFELHVSKDLWLVSGDATQLNQVLLNLCVNARDAMPGGGQLTLTATNRHLDQQYAATHGTVPSGAYVVIEVTDSGCGMSREVQDRIFEPFYTTKELGKGTGLGLSTVLGIVRSHGGVVTVQSEPGRGSAFRVWLPAHPDQGTQPPPATSARPAPIMGHGELILLVDDEAPVLAITRQTLETFGYRVLDAGDGAQAVGLYAIHQHEISAVLTDLMMPVMDGPMLIASLRRINPQVRLIAATGLNTSEYMNRAVALGVKHFLHKPYTAEELLTTVHQVLSAPAPTKDPA